MNTVTTRRQTNSAKAEKSCSYIASSSNRGVATQSARAMHVGSNQSIQSLLNASAGPGPFVHQSSQVDGILQGISAGGAAIGQNILLSRSLSGQNRADVLHHEMRHVAQVSGRNFNPSAALRLGARNTPHERAARSAGHPGHGADPQVIRRDDPPWSTPEDQGVCELDPSADADVDAGTCEIDENAVLENTTEPLTSVNTQELTTDPARQICQVPFAEASFDPELIDVPGMRNDTINSESIRVDEWISQHSLMSPVHDDLSAYRRLQQRLKAERAVRVQTGHLWMTTAVDPTPDELLMLHASSGETTIIRVDQSIASGVPIQSFPGPVMTRQQFDDHMGGLGIPILTEQEYIERLRNTAAQFAPQLLMAPDDSSYGAAFNPDDPFGLNVENDPFGALFNDPLGLGPLNPGAGIAPFQPGSFIAPYDPGGLAFGPFNIGSDDDRLRGYYGGQGRLDQRTQAISDTMPWSRNAFAARQGEIGEAAAMRQLHQNGAIAFDNGRYLWNARGGSNRIWQGNSGGNTPYRTPEGIDPFLPVRRARDNTAAVDLGTRTPVAIDEGARAFDLFSVKTSFGTAQSPNSAQANRNTRHGLYFDELAELGDTGRRNLRLFRDTHHPGADLDEVGARMALMIPQDHAAEVREVLRNPTGYETTNSGRRAELPNWAQRSSSGPRTLANARMRRHFSNAQFPADTPGLPSGIRTGADLHQRFQGNFDDPEFTRLINTLGESMSQRVHGFDLPENEVRWHQSYRDSLSSNSRAVNLRAGGIEFADWVETERRLAGDTGVYEPNAQRRAQALNQVTFRSSSRSAGMSGGMSLATNFIMDPSRYDDPELYRRAILEGGADFLATGLETRFNARLGREIVEEGLETSVRRSGTRVFASRLAGRAIPGLADAAMEIYDLTQDGRDNSTTEIIVRTGRAAVIGGGSAWAGAAVGTAVGGPVGFVVGLGVGLLVGWAANELLPGDRESWDREHAANERRRAREAQARRQAEHDRRLAAARARIARLNTPLSSTTAGNVGVEGIFGMPTNNPMFMSSQAGVEPTIGELEHEYILSVLRMSEQAAPPG